MPNPAFQLDPVGLATLLSARFGVALVGETKRDGSETFTSIRATDIQTPNGFCIKITFGWRSIQASFLPDTYAGNLIRAMGGASASESNQFVRLVQTFAELGNRLSIRINDTPLSSPVILPLAPWQKFELVALRMTDTVETGGEVLVKAVEEVAGACLAIVLSLLPLEEATDGSTPLFEGGLPEGARSRVEINRYERSPVNRAACIAIYGARCQVCGLEFGLRYGDIGNGYIEVHHRVPVSKMGAGYVVDPRQDLVPLCSNCHSMVHRQDPPLDVDELKKRLNL